MQKYYYFILIAFFTFSCQPHLSEVDESSGDELKFTILKKHQLPDVLELDGEVDYLPEGKVTLPVPTGGIVKKLYFNQGEKVYPGKIMAELEDPGYIVLQEKFLTARNQLEFYKQKFAREGELTVENAISIKKYQESQTFYREAEVKYLSLKMQCEYLGFNTDSLNHNNMQVTILLRAPAGGYVGNIRVNPGKHVDVNQPVCDILNTDKLQLTFLLDQEYCQQLQTGETVYFAPGKDSVKHEAVLKTIGFQVEDSGKLKGVAYFNNNNNRIKPGMRVQVHIPVKEKTIYVLPESSILKEGNLSYIFAGKKNKIEKIPVITGRKIDGKVEIIDVDKVKDKQVVESFSSLYFPME